MKPRIALVCSVGFSSAWHPLGISLLKENIESLNQVSVVNHYWSSEFTWYLNRYHPHLSGINDNIAELGGSYHKFFYASKLFQHASATRLIRQTLTDFYRRDDAFRTRNIGAPDGIIERQDPYFEECVMEYCRLLDAFLEKRICGEDWQSYDLVGFSCLDPQFLCSVHCAKRIRELGCDRPVLFGGGMFDGWNVGQYQSLFPFIDDFVVGDGFKPILRILKRKEVRLRPRAGSRQVHFGDFGDMPRRVLRSDQFWVPVRLSPGCSWGGCRFCDIRQEPRRRPDVARLTEWMKSMQHNLGVRSFGFVDSDLNGNLGDFGTMCRLLASSGTARSMYGMLNTDRLTRKTCAAMKKAGFSQVLLGVEAFSDRLLALMNKRARTIDNVKAIKWLVEADIEHIMFGLIVDFPGTDKQVIEESLSMARRMGHLIRGNVLAEPNEFDLDRSSEAFASAEALGIEVLGSYRYDRICYPEPVASNLLFDSVRHKWKRLPGGWTQVVAELRQKRRHPLVFRPQRDSGIILDRRQGRNRKVRLTGIESKVYTYVCRHLTNAKVIASECGIDPRDAGEILHRFEMHELAIRDTENYLGLAIVR